MEDNLGTIENNGYYGKFGGAFIPEILRPAINELSLVFNQIKHDDSFWQDFTTILSEYGGRPTPITFLKNLTHQLGGAKIYVKREDLTHTGSHKFNNVMGQGLLAKKLGKKRIIAETGAGQHGIATATMAARLGFDCTIYMGEEDVNRQYSNVFWIRQLGAEIVAVKDGTKTLKDAINAAMRDWAFSFQNTHYVLGTVCGPHPFPSMVAWFQSIMGQEAREQILSKEGKLPKRIYACVGGGSNAIGIFSAFLQDEVELVGVEAGGEGTKTKQHAARLYDGLGKVGVTHGYKSYFLQDDDGQMNDTYSIAAGLDYVGVSPILSYLAEKQRVRFTIATDKEVIEAFRRIVAAEGLIPALESTHAFAVALKEISELDPNECVLINQSGRGDKDIFSIADAMNDQDWVNFLAKRIKS